MVVVGGDVGEGVCEGGHDSHVGPPPPAPCRSTPSRPPWRHHQRRGSPAAPRAKSHAARPGSRAGWPAPARTWPPWLPGGAGRGCVGPNNPAVGELNHCFNRGVQQITSCRPYCTKMASCHRRGQEMVFAIIVGYWSSCNGQNLSPSLLLLSPPLVSSRLLSPPKCFVCWLKLTREWVNAIMRAAACPTPYLAIANATTRATIYWCHTLFIPYNTHPHSLFLRPCPPSSWHTPAVAMGQE